MSAPTGFASEFDALLALTHAAESCNGAARQFAEQYSKIPEWSHFQSGALCQPTADSQAAAHIGYARSDISGMEGHISAFDNAFDGLTYVCEAVVAMNPQPPIYAFNGQTHNTAHEAARAFAQWMVEIYRAAEGWNDREVIADLSKRLRDVEPIQDFYGYIQREHFAASERVQFGDADDVVAERTADTKTDKQKSVEKKLPPREVNDCIRYVRAQMTLISEGKRPSASKKELIAEHLGTEDTTAMEKSLQPSRYGWLLDLTGQADK